MEKTLQEAIRKAKTYGMPMVVYNGFYGLEYCSIEVFSKPYIPEYIVLSDGSFEKIGTANVHHG